MLLGLQVNKQHSKITVFYDGACPSCVKDRRMYEYLAGAANKSVYWFDITAKDEYLKQLGIDPFLAMTELHIQLESGDILSELDAYIELMLRVWLLKPIAVLLKLPLIKPICSKIYHQRVVARLQKAGRL